MPWFVIIAIFILFIGVLLLLRIGIRLQYGDELNVTLCVGAAAFHVYPSKKVKGKASNEKRKVDKKEKYKESKITFDAVRELILSEIPLLLDALNRVRKGICVENFEMKLTVSDEDPAVAAQRYGIVNSFLWPLLAAIENLTSVKRREVRIFLDFAAHTSSVSGEIDIRMRVYHGIRILITDGYRMIKVFLKFLKTTKVNQSDQSTQETKNSSHTGAA